MSILNCLNGKISKDIFKELSELHAGYVREFGGNITRADAALYNYVTESVGSVKKSRIMNAVKISELTTEADRVFKQQMDDYNALNKVQRGIKKAIGRKPRWDKVFSQVSYHRADILAEGQFIQVMDRMPAFTALMKETRGDVQVQETLMRGLVDGPDVTNDPKIRDAIVQLRKTLDWERPALETVGLGVGRVPSYVPIAHDAKKIIAQAGDDGQAWIDFIIEHSDLNKIYDFKTHKQGVTPERAREIYAVVFDTIKNGDVARAQRLLDAGLVTKRVSGMSDLFARRINYRVFHPKDADSYVAYNAKFGAGENNVNVMLTHHFRSTTRDLAVADTIGPRPETFHAHMRTVAASKGVGEEQLQLLDGEFRTAMNKWKGSVDSLLADTVQTLQKIQSSALLGGAGISAISDQAYVANFRRVFRLMDGDGAMSAFFNKFDGDAQDALQGAQIAEDLSRHILNRFDVSQTDPLEGKWAARATAVKDFTHRASGLEWMTTTAGDQAAIILAGHLGTQIRKGVAFEDLGAVTELFRRVGLNAADWRKLLANGIPEETRYLKPSVLPDELGEIATKLFALTAEARRFATNAPDLTMRAVASGRAFGERARGDKLNLFSTSVAQFKSFPVMVWRNHFLTSIERGVDGDLSPLMITGVQATILGAFALQMRELAKGKAPFEWDDPKFIVKAMVQGGFGGLIGDILLKDPTGFQRSLASELIGPVPATTATLTIDMLKQANKIAAGEDFDVPAFTRSIKPFIPLHSLWYLRAGFERGLMDSVNTMFDPDYYSTMARMRAREIDERGKLGWWPAGQ
jgi:hypothetical protein